LTKLSGKNYFMTKAYRLTSQPNEEFTLSLLKVVVEK